MSEPHSDWTDTLHTLATAGLNLWGVAGTDTGFAVVVGNGGGRLWERFVDWLRDEPARLAAHRHPLDRYIAECIGSLPSHPHRRWATADDPHLPIVSLARSAGLGHDSRLKLLLHPVYGPWMALRAVCFTDDDLSALHTGPLPEPPPCATCPAPCATACPAGAVGVDRFDLAACAQIHLSDTRCATTCHARDACPIGASHRYPDLAVHYHTDPVSGREALARALGIAAPGCGEGRNWAAVSRT